MTAPNINMVINEGTHYFHGDETDSYSANYNHTKTFGIYCNSNLTVSGSGTFNVYGYDDNIYGSGYCVYVTDGKKFTVNSATLNCYGSEEHNGTKTISTGV